MRNLEAVSVYSTHGQLASFIGAGCSVLCSFLGLRFDVEAFAQGDLDFGQFVADCFAKAKKRQNSPVGEFVDGSQGKSAVSGQLLASDLPGWEPGTGGGCVIVCHAAQQSRQSPFARMRYISRFSRFFAQSAVQP